MTEVHSRLPWHVATWPAPPPTWAGRTTAWESIRYVSHAHAQSVLVLHNNVLGGGAKDRRRRDRYIGDGFSRSFIDRIRCHERTSLGPRTDKPLRVYTISTLLAVGGNCRGSERASETDGRTWITTTTSREARARPTHQPTSWGRHTLDTLISRPIAACPIGRTWEARELPRRLRRLRRRA